jgi:DNA repair protein SbcC/Rad50
MNIEKITLSNFRNYKGVHNIDLNKRITILYGENGNGKSSFFDGVEWCLTGKVSRFTNLTNLKTSLANKSIKLKEECYVEIHFANFILKRMFERNENGFTRIEVSISEKKIVNNKKSIEKIAVGEENVDQFLRNELDNNGFYFKDKKHTVGELINKAYVLSQDQVTNFVSRDKPDERYQALASIMGFEQVIKLMKNIENAKKLLVMELDKLETESNRLSMEIQKIETQKVEVNHELIKKVKEINNAPVEDYHELLNNVNEVNSTLTNLRKDQDDIYQLMEANKTGFEKAINDNREIIRILTKDEQQLIGEEKEIEGRMKSIEKLLMDFNENLLIRNKISNLKEIETKLNEDLKRLDIKSHKIEEEEFVNHIKALRNKIRYVEFTVENFQRYHKGKVFLANYQEFIITKYELLEKERELLEKLSNKKDSLRNEILRAEDDTHLNILKKSLNEIISYLSIKDTKGKCPVCLSDVGDHLQQTIKNNLSGLLRTLEISKEKYKLKMNENNFLENDINRQEEVVKDCLKNIDELKINYNGTHQEIDYIENHKLFSGDLFLNNTKEDLLSLCDSLTKEMNKFDLGLSIIREMKMLQNDLSDYLVEDLNINNIEKDVLTKNIEKLRQKKDNIQKSIKKINTEKENENNKLFNLEMLYSKSKQYIKKFNAADLNDSFKKVLLEIQKNEEFLNIFHKYMDCLLQN